MKTDRAFYPSRKHNVVSLPYLQSDSGTQYLLRAVIILMLLIMAFFYPGPVIAADEFEESELSLESKIW